MSVRCAPHRVRLMFCCRLLLGSLGALALLAASCPTGPGGMIVDAINGAHTLYTSPAEKHLVQTTDAAGNTVTFSGQRDAAGNPAVLENVFIQAPGELALGQGTWLHFDAQSRPSRIQGSDGTVIRIDWQSSPAVVISAVSADGSVQVNTDAHLSTTPPTAKSFAPEAGRTGKMADVLDEKDVSVLVQQSTADSVLVVVNVSSACGGTPTENEVLDVNVLVNNNWYNAAPQGGGRFSVVIPLATFSPPADPARVKQVCDGLGNILSRACKDANYAAQLEADVCGALSAAFDASSASASARNSAANQCRKAFQGLNVVCYMAATGIASATPTPADSSNFICSNLREAIEVAVAPASTPLASATAYIEGTGYVNSGGTVNLSDAFVQGRPAQLSIQSPTENPGVLSVDISPSHPGANQGYTARATVNCAAGHKLLLTVVGSDGFSTDSVLISDQKVDTVEVNVPGGATGVQDTITLSIDDVVQRTTSLVFGP